MGEQPTWAITLLAYQPGMVGDFSPGAPMRVEVHDTGLTGAAWTFNTPVEAADWLKGLLVAGNSGTLSELQSAMREPHPAACHVFDCGVPADEPHGHDADRNVVRASDWFADAEGQPRRLPTIYDGEHWSLEVTKAEESMRQARAGMDVRETARAAQHLARMLERLATAMGH
jgi:hypothetical protein